MNSKTKAVSLRLLSHITINLAAVALERLESDDSTIALRSYGNQTLKSKSVEIS